MPTIYPVHLRWRRQTIILAVLSLDQQYTHILLRVIDEPYIDIELPIVLPSRITIIRFLLNGILLLRILIRLLAYLGHHTADLIIDLHRVLNELLNLLRKLLHLPLNPLPTLILHLLIELQHQQRVRRAVLAE